MNSCNLVTILVIVLLVLFVFMLFEKPSKKEDFDGHIPVKTFKRTHYSYPNATRHGMAPRGMYNRQNFVSPGFYSGSGLLKEVRPSLNYSYTPRNIWINSGFSKYDWVRNHGDYIHNAANYDYIRRYNCCS